MAVSQTDICNHALGRIGNPRIMSIDDADSKAALVCKNAYETTLREVLRNGVWNFAKDRATLARLTALPAFGWAYQYQLPTDWLRLVKFNGVDIHPDGVGDEWEIEGRKILTDAETAKIQYIKFVDDPNQYDALFVTAFTVLLASNIAVPIRQDEGLAARLLGEYTGLKLPTARKTDGNERKRTAHDYTAESRFTRSRYFSTNG
jgi:hypothetical protein